MLTSSADIAALSDLQGFGNVHSLHTAMALDTSGRLKSLVQQFVAESDPSARRYHAAHHVRLGRCQKRRPNSRSAKYIYGNAIGDARKLETLEAFLGEKYLGTWCWGERDPNPHGKAAPILLQAFDQLTNYMTQQLMAQTHLKNLFDGIALTWDPATSTFVLGTLNAISTLQSAYGVSIDNGSAYC